MPFADDRFVRMLPTMPLAPGTQLGSYTVQSFIAQGGMGQVYRARDTKLQRDVALKTLPGGAGDPDRLSRFEREARTLAALNHPHIAAIYGLEDRSGTPVLVMELVEGEDLAQRLDTTLIVGVTEDVDRDYFRNEAVVFGPDGEQIDRFEKVRRVPFGEYVPLRGLIEGLAGDDSGLPRRDAIEGTEPAFRCDEIRQRGPTALAPSTYTLRCGIQAVMLEAEQAWKQALQSRTLADLAPLSVGTMGQQRIDVATRWILANVRRNPRPGYEPQAGSDEAVRTYPPE